MNGRTVAHLYKSNDQKNIMAAKKKAVKKAAPKKKAAAKKRAQSRTKTKSPIAGILFLC